MLAALRLQIEWGVDEALLDDPVDRTARTMTPGPLSATISSVAAELTSAGAPGPAALAGPAARAQAAADSANTLEALYRTLSSYRECALAATATKPAIADGNPTAGLVLVGEVAGAEEDLEGRPFAGPAGRLLDVMLASIGLTRAQLLIVNLVPWRPPGGRAPTEAEVQICTPFLWRHLTLLRPHTIVTLGILPVRALTGRAEPIRRLRGRWQSVAIPGLPVPISMLPMLNPAMLLRAPAEKKEAWTDLVALRKHLDSYLGQSK